MNIPSPFQDEASTGERAALDHFRGWSRDLVDKNRFNAMINNILICTPMIFASDSVCIFVRL